MALVPLHDGTWHLTEPDEVWGGGVRAHYLDERHQREGVALHQPGTGSPLSRAIRDYGLVTAHWQPDQHRYVLVETKSIPS